MGDNTKAIEKIEEQIKILKMYPDEKEEYTSTIQNDEEIEEDESRTIFIDRLDDFHINHDTVKVDDISTVSEKQVNAEDKIDDGDSFLIFYIIIAILLVILCFVLYFLFK